MKTTRRSGLQGTISAIRNLWKRRRRLDSRKAKGRRFEALEGRSLLAGDLCVLPPQDDAAAYLGEGEAGEGEGSAPTLAPIKDVVLLGGSPLWIALDGEDVDGGNLTFTASVSNQTSANLITTSIPTGNKSWKINVAGHGEMVFQLFEHLAPRVTSRIIALTEAGFYDDTATNTVPFHRILNDFVIQGGDPTGTGSGGSGVNFDDQFHVDLQHNRSGLLSFAKTSDDTNDSQFFITEERNETQFVTLTGNPTGGSFTLTYAGQTTAAIAFDNTASFATMAGEIQTALAALSKIGAGNVLVTHDPLMSGLTVVENRRWKVEFTGALGHQEVLTLIGNGASLTGGTAPAVSIAEGPKSARHLDFNHAIFGVLTEGEAVRDSISNVAVNGSGLPNTPVIISNIDVFIDPENGALMLKAAEGASGEADVTVTVTDSNGNFSTRTFHVIVEADQYNGAPFLNDIAPVVAVSGQPIPIQLTAQDVENQTRFFDAIKPQAETVNYALTVDHNTGLVTVTPPAGFVGSFNVIVGVRGAVASDTSDAFDTEVVNVTVAPAAPTAVDLLASSDSNIDNDNITNESTLNFQVTGVTNGATVKLYRGTTVLGQATASGGVANITVSNLLTFGQGQHTITATQTIASVESAASPALNVTLDTIAPAAFTSAAPTEALVGVNLNYNAENPEEDAAGFSYSLSAAPSGATINSEGVVSWTPTFLQLGNHVFGVVAKDAAGNTTTQTVNLNVSEPVPAKIEVTVELTKPDGTPISTLGSNENFVLHVFVRDVRNEIQILNITGGPTGGTFTLSFGGQTTQPIDITSPSLAGAIDTALEALSTIGVGNVQVTNGLAGTFNVEFTGQLARQDVALLTGNASGLTGGTNPNVVINGSNGVFAATVDVHFDAAKAETTGPITFVSPYTNSQSGTSGPGLLNEVGSASTSQTPLGLGKRELFRVAMKAKQSGMLTFSTDAYDDASPSPPAVYGENTEVNFDAIRFGSVSILVNPTFQVFDRTFSVNEDSGATTLDPAPTINPGSGNVLTITSVGETSFDGTVQITQNGTRISYTPAANFHGSETFTYTVSNQNNESITKTITVNVAATNDPPDAVNDGSGTPIAVPEDSSNFLIEVLTNDTTGVDSDENVSTLRVTGVTQPAHGTVTFTATGVRYTPTANYIGPDSFTYTISDRATGGLTDTATVTLNVTESNDNPTAGADNATVAEDTADPITINVLVNDSFAPDTGETLTVTAVSNASNGGTIAVGPGGANVTYKPAANFQGTETFNYTLSDGRGGTAIATVTVTVTNTNDPPTANNDTNQTAFKNTPAKFNVLANDSSAPDPAETLTIDSVTQGTNGTVAITDNGTRITYTPSNNFTGSDTFTYKIKDASGAISSSATVQVNVQEFIPSSLAGFVYVDADRDGVKDGGESPIVGATVTLTGVTVNNSSVNVSMQTAADGSYKFDNLAPGNYTITEAQPAFMRDGFDTAGTQGGVASQDDKIVIASLAQNTHGTGNNFGENGLAASANVSGKKIPLMKLSDFFSSRGRSSALVAFDASGNQLWATMHGPAWNKTTAEKFKLVNNSQIKIEAKNSQNQNLAATLSTGNNRRVRLLTNQNGVRIFRITGGPSVGFNMSVVAASLPFNGSGGEGEGAGETAVSALTSSSDVWDAGAVDAVIASMSSALKRKLGR